MLLLISLESDSRRETAWPKSMDPLIRSSFPYSFKASCGSQDSMPRTDLTGLVLGDTCDRRSSWLLRAHYAWVLFQGSALFVKVVHLWLPCKGLEPTIVWDQEQTTAELWVLILWLQWVWGMRVKLAVFLVQRHCGPHQWHCPWAQPSWQGPITCNVDGSPGPQRLDVTWPKHQCWASREPWIHKRPQVCHRALPHALLSERAH